MGSIPYLTLDGIGYYRRHSVRLFFDGSLECDPNNSAAKNAKGFLTKKV
jgi:hypothetical protein